MQSLLAIVGAYLLGSVSFAIVVSRLMALPDPRSYGSGNPGATNVLRTGKKAAALLVLLGDGGKGWLAVWLGGVLVDEAALCGFAVFVGHLYPLFHRFKGGKGVATAAGVLLGLNAWLGLATIATWLIIAFFFRYSSLAALVAAVFAPVYAFWLFGIDERVVFVLAIALLLVMRHRENIHRLLAGTESRIGAKKATPPDPNAASQ
ncbi:MAG TPA: glycerol-3-phosphate 1-O-acyltransferase PlsY [Burkholderiales bacterium]|nr:glycerol-3-phosphate 1-O-acyltransferase PlsY [Burkholderiales bacterium]